MKTRIIGFRDILNLLSSPVGRFICGILCCMLAFNVGLRYARATVEVHSITNNLAFIEIAGQEHMYELDWSEPEPIVWESTEEKEPITSILLKIAIAIVCVYVSMCAAINLLYHLFPDHAWNIALHRYGMLIFDMDQNGLWVLNPLSNLPDDWYQLCF